MTIVIGAVEQKREDDFFDIIDDWVKYDRFVYLGWSGLLLSHVHITHLEDG